MKPQAANAASIKQILPLAPAVLGAPDYFGSTPNWANSPLPLSVSIWGEGQGATATAAVDPSTGAVTGFSVTSPGTGYVQATTSVTVNGGGGSGATASAAVTAGAVTAIAVVAAGTGYTVTPVNVAITGVGSGAAALASVDATGVVSAIRVTAGGTGYVQASTGVTVKGGGGGGGATAHATVNGGGAISAITVDAAGSGYKYAGMRKFIDTLPQLTPNGANDLGHYLSVGHPDTITFPGSDYYEIELRQYTEQLHADLPPTTLRGYVQVNNGTDGSNHNTIPPDPISYLGPTIVASGGTAPNFSQARPVRIKFTNKLGTGTDGNLFIPTDTTDMGAGLGPLKSVAGGPPVSCNPEVDRTCDSYTQNRATLHLHGGNTPWISDGTPHQWTTPATENTVYPKGVSVQNVPDMWFDAQGHPVPPGTAGATNNPGAGSLAFYYTNQQSARLMFYHDHSYGITRLNVYAGEAAGYLLNDPVEQGLINTSTNSAGVLPQDQLPLIVQDKTFVPDPGQKQAEDPTWASVFGGKGNVWFPHVYMPNQNPYDNSGANPMGRWDYGPWFWPPFTGLMNGPVQNPFFNPTTAPWEPPMVPGTPNPSLVPEGFMDTPMVNGTPYPKVTLEKKAYRLRILNASNDRMLNLQLYCAKSQTAGSMWNANGTLADGDAGEVSMVPAVQGTPQTQGYTTDQTDGRAGGLPDATAKGPDWVQIGTEGGILPQVAVVPSQPVGYNYNRRDIVVLNVTNKSLFLGPAERADAVVDFRTVPTGCTRLIMYNDAPAPVPASDPRNDYYTGSPDQTEMGGAPPTQPGFGPNTRTVMQIELTPPVGTPFDFKLGNLQTALPIAFRTSQDKPIVPETAYNQAYPATPAAVDTYSRIQDTSFGIFNGPLSGLLLTNPGTGYTTPPAVSIVGGGATANATATAVLAPAAVAGLTITNGGSGYTTAPTVTIAGAGAGATARATLATSQSVKAVTLTNGGANYTGVPLVKFTGGGGTGAAATATVNATSHRVTGVTVTNPGSGYTSIPTVSFQGGGGTGAAATASMGRAVASLSLVTGGSGYPSNPAATPTVTIAAPPSGGVRATATSSLAPTSVASFNLTSPGTGYTSAPFVGLAGGGGTSATAAAVGIWRLDMGPKAIQELFETEYGRMNATLGVELPNTTGINQTTIPYGYVDPLTEDITGTPNKTVPIGAPNADGTQIWKVTHNGVDTHAIHFHLFNVQLINRVGWDGAIRPPDANELGWKETVIMNPLEDAIVALRPTAPTIPTFKVPDSIRLLDPTLPEGVTSMRFMNIDPATGNPIVPAITNQMYNFGWEYVWHCHLLGHEENDMMRPIGFRVSPAPPANLTAGPTNPPATNKVLLNWTNNAVFPAATSFTVQRATNTAFTAGLVTTAGVLSPTFTDNGVAAGTYYYRVRTENSISYSVWSATAGPVRRP